ncbi:hypothetical protein TREES_T100004501 [Tupaia chinensis]|uniref:Uncharacterized protein n=1 Tax=Tupaia chinensis TaxID=246437 RepID=L9JWX1_TUPCH|nr:hypothetical protein TREES_T100004501 [Tupaia chinensis]
MLNMLNMHINFLGKNLALVHNNANSMLGDIVDSSSFAMGSKAGALQRHQLCLGDQEPQHRDQDGVSTQSSRRPSDSALRQPRRSRPLLVDCDEVIVGAGTAGGAGAGLFRRTRVERLLPRAAEAAGLAAAAAVARGRQPEVSRGSGYGAAGGDL